MNGTSSKPAFVTKTTVAPRRSITAFVATVVPTTTCEAPEEPSSRRSPSRIATDASSGVDGTFVTRNVPTVSSKSTKSVKVPPVSIPTRAPMDPLVDARQASLAERRRRSGD